MGRWTKDVTANVEFSGVVKKWNSDRSFGFISCEPGGEEVWVHRTAIGDLTELSPGDRVLFQKVDDGKARGKFKAHGVRVVTPANGHSDAAPKLVATDANGYSVAAPKIVANDANGYSVAASKIVVNDTNGHSVVASESFICDPAIKLIGDPLPVGRDLFWPIKDLACSDPEDAYYESLQKYSIDELARMFVEADLLEHPGLQMGMAINILRHVLREKIGEEKFLWDSRFGSAEGGKVVANVLEDAMADFLRNSGIQFKSETTLRMELMSSVRTVDIATPDFVLLEDVRINGQLVRWIDCKCTFGSARILAEGLKSGKSQMAKNLVSQGMRYNQGFGPGAFVYSLGFSEGLADEVGKAQRNLVNSGQFSDMVQSNGRSPNDIPAATVPLFLDASLLDTKKLMEAIARQNNQKQLERWHFPLMRELGFHKAIRTPSTRADSSSSGNTTLTHSSMEWEPVRPR